jgi:hypothetical protein
MALARTRGDGVIEKHRTGKGERRLRWASTVTTTWVLVFIVLHIYWFAGGRLGFGDRSKMIPGLNNGVDVAYAALIAGMFLVGLVLPSALAHPWGRQFPRRAL